MYINTNAAPVKENSVRPASSRSKISEKSSTESKFFLKSGISQRGFQQYCKANSLFEDIRKTKEGPENTSFHPQINAKSKEIVHCNIIMIDKKK